MDALGLAVVMRARRVVAAMWGGSLWTIGFVVAPTLFYTLNDRVLAGNIAGSLFRVEGWLTMACAVLFGLLLWLSADIDERQRRLLERLVLAMLACTLLSFFIVQPMMTDLLDAASTGQGVAAGAATQFKLLHTLGGGLHLLEAIFAVMLVANSK